MKSATKGYFQWAHSYGLASEIRTDDGPGFRSEFTEAVQEVGTKHINSSAYNPTSNGCAERGVGQIKSVLEKLGKKNILSQEFLNFVVYKINSHVSKDTGSALQRFFGRPMQTYIPTLVKKSFDQAAAIRRRSEEQLAIAQKLGRRSADSFKKDDLVVCQNSRTGKWTVRGRIIKARTAEDGSVRTFEVKTESGTTTLRNARFIRHQTKKKDVSWAADETEPDDTAELKTKPDDAAARGTSSSPGSPGSPGTDIVTEQRRVSERLAARENRF